MAMTEKRKKTNNIIIRLFLIAALGFSFSLLQAQKTAESLKAKRKKLEKEIAYTNKLLAETRKNKKSTLYELKLLQNKIKTREELTATLKKEIADLDKKIAKTRNDILLTNKKLQHLKKDYAQIISFLSRHNNDLDKLIFLFSSEDLNQAYQRFRYMDEMLQYIKKQADTIQRIELNQKKELEILNRRKAEKNILLEKENIQVDKLEKNLKEKDKINSALVKKEKQLRKRLKEKQREATRLNKEVENIIARETRARNSKSGKTVSKISPADKKLAGEFEKNKGKLPWPVEKGFVTESFGTHPHPVLKHIKINNNGINIATSKNSKAKSVFKGKVVSVAQISNTNHAVIVKHGKWFTVYSNLDEVFVKRGDNVDTGTPIGKIHTNLKGKTELHFEIWYGKKKQNPAYWIRK